eukprot:scaffold61231_cov65-Phaeocystis_antarctica.AAC.1
MRGGREPVVIAGVLVRAAGGDSHVTAAEPVHTPQQVRILSRASRRPASPAAVSGRATVGVCVAHTPIRRTSSRDAPAREYDPRVGVRSGPDPELEFGLGLGSVRARAWARNAPAVLVADHRPILPRDGIIGAQVAQCVVRVVVVVPVLMAVVPAPAL